MTVQVRHRVDTDYPGQGDKLDPLSPHTLQRFTKEERAMLTHTGDYSDEDRDKARLTGKWRCLVCGMRHRYKKEAVACCHGLTPGRVPGGRRQARSVHVAGKL